MLATLMVTLGMRSELVDEVAPKLVRLAVAKYVNPLPQCSWEFVPDVLLIVAAHRARQIPVDIGQATPPGACNFVV